MKSGHRDPNARRHVRSQRYTDAELSAMPSPVNEYIRRAALRRWVAVRGEELFFYCEAPAADELPVGAVLHELP